MVRLLAEILEVELDGLEEFYQRWYTAETFEVPIGRMARDTLAAVRFSVAEMVDGAAPGRDRGPAVTPARPHAEGGQREGHSNQGVQATAMRLVNVIPAVVASAPGLVTPLGLTLGRGRALLNDRRNEFR